MANNIVKILQSFPENKSGYRVFEIELDGVKYFAAKSKSDTWKVTNEKNVTTKSKQLAIFINGKNCGIHLISLLDRMLLAGITNWEGLLPRILAR